MLQDWHFKSVMHDATQYLNHFTQGRRIYPSHIQAPHISQQFKDKKKSRTKKIHWAHLDFP